MTEQKGKDSIMKMLLSAPNQTTSGRSGPKAERGKPAAASRDSDDGRTFRLSSRLQELTGQGVSIQVATVSTVDLDHNYSRPWNWRPENSYTKPLKTLFVHRSSNSVSSNSECVEAEEWGPAQVAVYDGVKARRLMEESERHVDFVKGQPGDPDWETNVDRSEWSAVQSRLFERVCRLLSQERLARLAVAASWNEPVLRRVALDKTAARFRATLASVAWEPKLLNWLHNLLMDLLDSTDLVAYIDVLQTLKSKVPALMDRMLVSPSGGKSHTECLSLLLHKPWDPSAFGMSSYNPKSLPGNPILLVVPSGPHELSPTSRQAKWLTYLSQLGTVMSVTTPISPGGNKISVMASLEQMMAATRAKISEIRSDFMGKKIVLVGWNTGAALACQVALLEHVTAVVCLGFPLNTAEDKRGQPDDNLLNTAVPVLFVIGQHAATSYIDDVEDLRERLHVETGLVVVGAADDQLRITKSKQGADGITQSMVDRCILDEVGDFIGTILSNPYCSGRSEARPRVKTVERKRRLSAQDELYGKKRGSQNTAPYVRKPRTTNPRGGGAVGRSRWTAQVHRSLDGNPAYKQDSSGSVASITRTPASAEKSQTGRPSIDNISVVNATSSDGDSVSNSSVDPTANLLSQIKVLRSEDCSLTVSSDTTNLVNELTPDSLLEMPVIIAQEDPQELPVKVVLRSKGSGGGRISAIKCRGSSESDCKIFLRKKEASERGKPSTAAKTLYFSKQEMELKPRRIQRIPAKKRSDVDVF